MSAIMNNTPTPQETKAPISMVGTGNGSDVMMGGHHFNNHYSQQEIKNEPPEDGDRRSTAMENNNSNERYDTNNAKIRLTPTIKLMATPNPTDPKRKFACPYENCTKSYGKSSHLRSHLTWHSGIKPFVCQEPNCGKGFTRSDELNRHVRTHTGEKPFECIQCTKKFSRSDHLTKHLATHAKQMLNNSKRVFSQQNETAPNATTSTSATEEPDTKKIYMDLQNPSGHMNFSDGMHFMAALIEGAGQMKHEQSGNTENLTVEPPVPHLPIKIKLEKPEFSNEYHIVPPTPSQLHAQSQARAQLQSQGRNIAASESEEDAPSDIMPVSTMLCPSSPDIKEEHSDEVGMSDANTSGASAPIDGATIGMPEFGHFTAEVAYDPERPFRCNQCGKTFKRQDDLNRHCRTHTGEKPFACNECDRRYKRSDHLKKHMRTHTKLR